MSEFLVAGKPLTTSFGVTEEQNAELILRDLALDSTDDPTQNTQGALNKNTTVAAITAANDMTKNHKPKPSPPSKPHKQSGFPVSPKRLLNGLGIKSGRQSKSGNGVPAVSSSAVTGVCEMAVDSGTSSNDSLSQPTNLSPRHRTHPETLSPRHNRASNSKSKPLSSTQGLLVPGMFIIITLLAHTIISECNIARSNMCSL